MPPWSPARDAAPDLRTCPTASELERLFAVVASTGQLRPRRGVDYDHPAISGYDVEHRRRGTEHYQGAGHDGRGSPYDNAQAESFIKTVKCEEVCLDDYDTFDDVVAHLPRFLDQVYNERRLRAGPGYLSPMDFEARRAQQAGPISGTDLSGFKVHATRGRPRALDTHAPEPPRGALGRRAQQLRRRVHVPLLPPACRGEQRLGRPYMDD